MVRAVFGVIACAIVLGSSSYAFAQTDETEQLRAEIRAALLADTRSLELSSGELEEIVSVLAANAEVEGLVYDLLAPSITFADTGENYFPDAPGSRPVVSEFSLYALVIVSLLLSFLLLRHLFERHRPTVSEAATAGNTDATGAGASHPF